jgi:uncharacterized membrane protein
MLAGRPTMPSLLEFLATLPAPDWLALAIFIAAWIGYVHFARRRAHTHPSILGLTNRIRHRWMLQTTWRDVRVIDGPVFLNLSTSVSFFASTTILIIGGLLAVLGTTERASELVREIPFAARTSLLVFDLKVVVLIAIFVLAFFRFTWSIRQYSFGALLVAAAPEARQFEEQQLDREAFARKAGTIVAMAAQTFNDGLRAYYFSFAVLAWFFSPWAFMVATGMVVWVLYQREFNSAVVAVLSEEGAGAAAPHS